MSKKVSLTAAGNPTDAIEEVLSFLQKSHRGGGALFASFTPHGPTGSVPSHGIGLHFCSPQKTNFRNSRNHRFRLAAGFLRSAAPC